LIINHFAPPPPPQDYIFFLFFPSGFFSFSPAFSEEKTKTLKYSVLVFSSEVVIKEVVLKVLVGLSTAQAGRGR
jgi:hypothetical protein